MDQVGSYDMVGLESLQEDHLLALSGQKLLPSWLWHAWLTQSQAEMALCSSNSQSS